MDAVNKVKIAVCGSEYTIATNEEPSYVEQMGEYINDVVTTLMQQNPSLSITKALVLCCLSFQDDLNQANTNADNLRTQVTEYLDDASRYRSEADELRRENARLKKELERHGM